MRQLLVIGHEDLSKVTNAQLNQKIINLTGAANDSGSDSEESADENE